MDEDQEGVPAAMDSRLSQTRGRTAGARPRAVAAEPASAGPGAAPGNDTAAAAPASSAPQVRQRRVFYVPGYDPILPRRYRELYRTEAAAQAALSGVPLVLKPKATSGRYGWRVEAGTDGARVTADVEVMVWADIVSRSLAGSVLRTYLRLARTAWIYTSSGALFRMMRLRKGPVIAALYPPVALLGQLLLALVCAWMVAAAIGWIGGSALWRAAGWVPGLALAGGILKWFKKNDKRFFAYYMMNDFAFAAHLGGAYPPELEARMAEFGADIAAALASDTGEVLVVGHSSGASLAVSILADLIRAGKVRPGGPALSLLTLGQVIPMSAFLPGATRLRGDLRYLSARDELYWLDVSAPSDGGCFALCDPVAVTGVGPPGKRWPVVVSAAFRQTLTPGRWRALRWDFFRLHVQYLCAFDKLPGHPWDYDYFRVTAGPLTLGTRYADRQPSASRIETPVSGYTSTVP